MSKRDEMMDDYDHLIWRIERYKHFIKKCREVDDTSNKLTIKRRIKCTQ